MNTESRPRHGWTAEDFPAKNQHPTSRRDPTEPSDASGTLALAIDATQALKLLLAGVVIFLCLGLLVDLAAAFGHPSVFGLAPLFDLDGEKNAPTYFSTLLLLIASVEALVIAHRETHEGGRWRWHWRGLAIALAAMSFDEFVSVHELLIPLINGRYHLESSYFHYAWIIAAFPAMILMALAAWPMVRSLPRRESMLIAVAALVYFGGAVGVEMPEGRLAAIYGTLGMPVRLLAVLEEGMEMSGAVLLIYALLRLSAREGRRDLRIRFE